MSLECIADAMQAVAADPGVLFCRPCELALGRKLRSPILASGSVIATALVRAAGRECCRRERAALRDAICTTATYSRLSPARSRLPLRK